MQKQRQIRNCESFIFAAQGRIMSIEKKANGNLTESQKKEIESERGLIQSMQAHLLSLKAELKVELQPC